MDADNGSDFFRDGFKGFPRQLPDNCVDYVLAILDTQLETRRLLSELELIRKSAIETCERLTSEYIWQRDGFQLQVKTENGLSYLHGTTDYGDSVEDEWLIVYLLRDITRSRPNLWARVSDSDGEFLLIEAANAVPKWLSPELDGNRAWINQGQLKIITLEAGDTRKMSLSLSEAVQALRSSTESTMHSEAIENEAFYRLRKYPSQISESLHYSVLTVPRKLACMIHTRPATIAAAIEAFYLRNPISEKTLSLPVADLHYPPTDLVDSSIKFSKVLFAQLKSQHFRPPTHWETPIETAETNAETNEDAEKHLERLSMGMKLTSGYEMLTADAHSKDNRVVREYAILLEDLEADLQEERETALPSNETMSKWPHHGRNDDESWLDINFEDFEKELDGAKSVETEKKSGFGSATAHADLQKIVSRFEAFLTDENAGMDGAEQEDMDEDNDTSDSEDEDVDIDFDEAQFAKIMQDMLGLKSPGHNAEVSNSTRPDSIVQEVDSNAEDEDHDEIQKLAAAMEAELNGHGALKLDSAGDNSKLLQNKPKNKGKSRSTEEKSDSDDDDDVDVDYNLAKNLLESFKSQAGLAGPAGNILGMMGMQLPRDEGDEDLPSRK